MNAGEKPAPSPIDRKAPLTIKQRKSIVLMLSIGLSFVLWLLVQLSGDQVSYIKLELQYEKLPAGQVVVNKLPEEARVKVRGNGWAILFSLFSKRTVSIDLSKLGSRSLILTNYNINLFTRDLPADFQVLHIEPDSISIDYNQLITKKVPVRLLTDLQFSPSYDISGLSVTRPDSVQLSGPQSVMDTINFWPTNTIEGRSVSETLEGKTELRKTGNSNLLLSGHLIEFEIPVEQFTEYSVMVPVETTGGVDDTTLRILPRQVRVNFEVPLSRYENIKPDQFRAEVDLTGLADTTDNLLEIRMVKFPSHIKNISYQPPYTEFFYMREE